MDGILLVDKPAGWTSFDVVAKVRGIIKAETGQKIKIGHTGTLDPMATGLLVLVLGKYTKKAEQFSKLDKSYEAEVTMGQVSTTADAEGDISEYRGEGIGDRVDIPTKKAVESAMGTFLGQISQTPPQYSAIKIDGQRAYKMARAGKKVKIEPRTVTIYEITGVDYVYPKLKLTAKVSSGTYIRSLAEDIGTKLDTGAYLSALRRTKVGNFSIENAIAIDEKINYGIIKDEIQTPPK